MEDNRFDKISVVKVFGKCLIFEMIISVIGMFILAVVLSKTSVNDDIMGKCIIGISAFAVGLGGLAVSRKIKMKGIVCGAIQGILYMMLLYLISSIASGNFSLKLEGIIMIIVGIVAGSFGGIVGVNFKN